MTPKQIELARHTIGLDYNKKSFRNHFVCGKGEVNDSWEDMVNKGFATVRRNVDMCGGGDVFHMTLAGAKAVLRRGEKLCQEDFPEHPKQAKKVKPPTKITVDFKMPKSIKEPGCRDSIGSGSKRCPFCGSGSTINVLKDSRDDHIVSIKLLCFNCPAEMKLDNSEVNNKWADLKTLVKRITKYWNKRI